jgi:hypothetical protein
MTVTYEHDTTRRRGNDVQEETEAG